MREMHLPSNREKNEAMGMALQSVQILPSAIFRSGFGWGFDIWIFI